MLPVEQRPGSYRYHALLQDFLGARLRIESPATVLLLRRRAAQYYLRQGDVEAALQQWSELVSGRLVKPAWAPPTLALALWRLDRKPEAVRWYAAAVRTEPALWRDPARLPALLPDWTEADRALLGEVLAAWSADPPPWP